MGKVRKRRPNRATNNVPINKTDEEELPVDSRENVIQTMIDQIQTSNVEEKYCGLQTFAMLIESPESLELMFRQGIVKIVAPLIVDQALPIRNAAAGSLRNASLLSVDNIHILIDHDVLTPLVCFFHQYVESWTPDVRSKTNDEEIDTFIQCTYLLINLCEYSDIAIQYIENSRILDIFSRLLDVSTFGAEVLIGVLQIFFLVAEGNSSGVQKVRSVAERQLNDLILLESNDPSVMYVKVLAGGIIINLAGGHISALPVNVMNRIFAILAQILSVDPRLVCNQLSSEVPLGDSAGRVMAPKGKEALELECKIRVAANILDSQQTAIEISTNICNSEATATLDSPVSSDSEDMEGEEDENNETGCDDIPDNSGEPLRPEDRIPPAVIEGLNSLGIFERAWARTHMPADNVLMILQEFEGTKGIYRKIHCLQTRSFLCINNILLSLPIDTVGGIQGIYKIWTETGKLVFKQNSKNLDMVVAATTAMRAALSRLSSIKDVKPSENGLFNDLALSDIELMIATTKECECSEIRANLVRMLGVLALLFFNDLNESTSEVIYCITEFIIEQTLKESEVWVVAEGIDALIDLYTDDKTDRLAARVKLADKLQRFVPILRSKMRQFKDLPKDYKALVSTVNSNLPRFIKYKKGRIAKLQETEN